MSERQKTAVITRFTADLTSGGQLTVPKHVREEIGVGKGDTLELYAKQYGREAEVIIEE